MTKKKRTGANPHKPDGGVLYAPESMTEWVQCLKCKRPHGPLPHLSNRMRELRDQEKADAAMSQEAKGRHKCKDK